MAADITAADITESAATALRRRVVLLRLRRRVVLRRRAVSMVAATQAVIQGVTRARFGTADSPAVMAAVTTVTS